jgi:hypothetical protein
MCWWKNPEEPLFLRMYVPWLDGSLSILKLISQPNTSCLTLKHSHLACVVNNIDDKSPVTPTAISHQTRWLFCRKVYLLTHRVLDLVFVVRLESSQGWKNRINKHWLYHGIPLVPYWPSIVYSQPPVLDGTAPCLCPSSHSNQWKTNSN